MNIIFVLGCYWLKQDQKQIWNKYVKKLEKNGLEEQLLTGYVNIKSVYVDLTAGLPEKKINEIHNRWIEKLPSHLWLNYDLHDHIHEMNHRKIVPTILTVPEYRKEKYLLIDFFKIN